MIKGFIKASDLKGCKMKNGNVEVAILKVKMVDSNAIAVVKDSNDIEYEVGLELIFDSRKMCRNYDLSEFDVVRDNVRWSFTRTRHAYYVIDGVLYEDNATLVEVDPENDNNSLLSFEKLGVNYRLGEITNIYDSKDEADKYEKTTFYMLDGTIVETGGEYRKYMLTDHQKKLIEKLKAVYKECEDAHIFFTVTDNGNMYAVNNENGDIRVSCLDDDELDREKRKPLDCALQYECKGITLVTTNEDFDYTIPDTEEE